MMRKIVRIFLLSLFVATSFNLSAQKYAVYFTDKENSPYSANNPEAFLSQRSIERRARHYAEITEQDFPVNPQYVEALKNLGAQVPYTSRWLNCALVSCSQSIVNQIEQLSFVDQVVYVSPESYGGKPAAGKNNSKFLDKLESEDSFEPVNPKNILENHSYGAGHGQINQINGIPVHEQGYDGEGVLIAVLDAGFRNVNALSVFGSLYTEERLVFECDIVVPGGNIYASNINSHGTNVLSCMSANIEGQFVGTAPKASYALIRTEDADTEYLVECYNWVIGIEIADSIGADIANSSLSYSTFDDPSMNYTYPEMDGHSAVASYSAQLAIEKGIFVTISAGNSNGSSWPWVGSPADATNAATIGAVNSSGNIAYFSSLGPNGAGEPKPNTVAEGVNAVVFTANGNIGSSSGTSFSSPITCGMYACLIQAAPSVAPALLRDIVDETGDRYPDHDIAYGYGIPDFTAALEKAFVMSALEIIDIEISDAQGNNNNKLNPGETVSLNITFHNKFSEMLEHVDAVLSSDDPDVNFVNDNADFGTFLPDETKTIDNVFTFTLSENATANGSVKFYINASSSNDKEIQCIFTIDIYGDFLQYPLYSVHFKDKNNSPYSLNEPLAYLSQKAVDRRNKYGVAVTEEDFPVNPDYIEAVEDAGAAVHSSGRWSNFVLVYAEEETMDAINLLDFVEKTVYVKPGSGNSKKYETHPKWENEKAVEITSMAKPNYNYGYTYDQMKQLNGVCVHENGFEGEGVLIAVLDAGFEHVDIIDGFNHLFESDRIRMAEDIVESGNNVYKTGISSHGASVLSCMAGFIEGRYVGSAPQASYALIRTEDVATEYLIEEYFWAIGAEKADSLGADAISSSLSYYDFDDPSMNHQYAEMDGKSTVSSIAAKKAAERGIFVANCAGNSNGSSWPWVGTPADAPEALTVGAVDLNGNIAYFSSIGPNGAGDPKPNSVACGSGTYVIYSNNQIGEGSGTSYATPLTCGMIACIIQAAPDKTPAEILKAVEMSADRYPEHYLDYGYGVPDFCNVLKRLGVPVAIDALKKSNLTIYPNPVDDRLYINADRAAIRAIEIFDVVGRMIKTETVNERRISIDMKGVHSGVFFVKIIYDDGFTETIKAVKK